MVAQNLSVMAGVPELVVLSLLTNREMYGYEIARAIKEWNPDFPIILGGWHPSLLPTQTLEAPYIDYVVKGQGEDSLLELVNHIAAWKTIVQHRAAGEAVKDVTADQDWPLPFEVSEAAWMRALERVRLVRQGEPEP